MAKEYYYEYKVVDGERFDTIAHKVYGNAALMTLLIADNPHVPTKPYIDAGETLFVRQEISEENTINNENLPPWRQN